jgi:hypothetical protein
MFILKYTRFIFVLFTLIVGVQYTAWSNPVNDPPADTTEGKPIRKVLTKDSAEQYSNYLLTTHPTYLDHWINDVTFVFDDFKYEHLPEEIVLPLVTGDEQFTMTWYGRINSTYKRRWGRQHHGLDIHLRTGDTVVAAFDGIVRYAQYNKSGFGNCVIIRHLNGLETVYAHLSKIHVQPNAFVTSGQSIGLGGNTGHSKGPHLHFETRYKDFSFDPELYIDVKTQTLKLDTLVLKPESFTAYRYLADRKQKASENSDSAKTANNPVPVVAATTHTTTVNPDTSTNQPVAATPPATPSAKPVALANTPASGTPTTNSSKPTSVTTTKPATKPTTNPTPANKPTANTTTKSTTTTRTAKTGTTNTKTATGSKSTAAKPGASKATGTTGLNKSSKTTTSKAGTTTTKKNQLTAKKTTTNQPNTGQKTKTTTPKKSGKSYTITAGDNLTVISQKTGVPIQKIRKLNTIKADNKLMPGQVLRLN